MIIYLPKWFNVLLLLLLLMSLLLLLLSASIQSPKNKLVFKEL